MNDISNHEVLVVGLGNPGDAYAQTRHNVGWMVLDQIHSNGYWTLWGSVSNGLISTGSIGDVSITLLKPTTMMNSSGEAVKTALCVSTDLIIIVHDELDIDFADVRSKFGGGHAGHRGVKSVIEALNTPDFHRVRCGIGRPASGLSVIDHVLSIFTTEESQSIPGMIEAAMGVVKQIITNFATPKE